MEEKNGEKRQIGVWNGYFNEIMQQIKPEKEGWNSLVKYGAQKVIPVIELKEIVAKIESEVKEVIEAFKSIK